MGGSGGKPAVPPPSAAVSAEERERWKRDRQSSDAKATFVAEGGRRLSEGELPEWFRTGHAEHAAARSSAGCDSQRAAVTRCLGKDGPGMGHPRCDELLDEYNRCQQRHFTLERVAGMAEAQERAEESAEQRRRDRHTESHRA
eukprot:TRINITY_DN44588_c0_g1_i1.p3 TRINITY_DN44588_c0_g1~~TRINITY_DN44588_c0_g1_i1.p3  ORF type:complete len:163 (+),score=52.13 TRINITY_DN44588_c0_g1_i1:61-489(+)